MKFIPVRTRQKALSPTYPSGSRSQLRVRTLLIILSALSKNSIVVASGSSGGGGGGGSSGSAGYNVYNYDLTTPQFTPDGLLKQVEYACAAPMNSMPMIIVPITLPPSSTTTPPTDDEDNFSHQQHTVGTEYALIIATVSSPTKLPNDNSSDPPNNNNNNNNNNDGKHNANAGRRGQSRIIEIPIPSSSGGSVIIGLNGILSDSVSLLQTARQSVQSHQSRYGSHRGASSSSSRDGGSVSVASAKRIAESIANRCQEHSFGGGMRPFGVSMVVCGLDRNCGGDGGGGRMIVCVTDPSGGISSYRYGSDGAGGHNTDNDGNESFDLTDVIVVGGEEKTKALIRKQLVERLRRSSIGTTTTTTDNNVDTEPIVMIRETNEDRYARILRQSIRATVEALAHLPSTTGDGVSGNVQRSNTNDGGHFFRSKRTTADTTSNTKDEDDAMIDNNKYEKVAEQMDLIIMTSRAGVQRLGKAQILDLMKSRGVTTNTSTSSS